MSNNVYYNLPNILRATLIARCALKESTQQQQQQQQ